MKELSDDGKLTPIINKRYPLSQTADAIRDLENGRTAGEIVVEIYENKEPRYVSSAIHDASELMAKEAQFK